VTRRWMLALACVSLAMAFGLVVQHVWLEPAPAVVPEAEQPATLAQRPDDLPPTISLTARVEELEGVVEVYDTNSGRWRDVTKGEEISDDAVLRTQRGRVELQIGDTIEVEVSPFSQFRLRELTNRLSKVRLEQGLVTANVTPNEESELVMQVLGSEVEAHAKDGAFAVLRGHQGQATVAGKRGTVTVQSAGTSVVIQQGQQSVIAPGEAPTPPTTIPGELLVKITQGQNKKLRFRSTRVEGLTSPGAVVTVNGVVASASTGHFSVNVPLNEGSNSITVVSRDALGREKKQVVNGVEVDTSPPTAKGRVQW
jgi:Glucodextranase, domain B/FecR protein